MNIFSHRYNEGDMVEFDVGGAKGTGVICGISATAPPIDFWIVKIITRENFTRGYYNYSCIVVPHPQLKRI